MISEILSKGEQLRLRQDVIKDLYHLDFSGVRSTDILTVVKQYVTLDKKVEGTILEALDSLLLGEQGR